MVRCAGGEPILGLVDGRRWRGWLVPWFPDTSLERIAETYYTPADDEPTERAPWQTTCGTWDMRDDDGEQVALERHRKRVQFPDGGPAGFLALTDSRDMGWCWSEVAYMPGLFPSAALALAASELECDPPAKSKRKGGRHHNQ